MQDSDTNLSKQVLSEQLRHDWIGQSKVAIGLCDDLKIHGLFDSEVSKAQFKARVKRACQQRNDEELSNQIQSYKKMSALRNEIVKGNSCFFTETLENVRILFRYRVELYEAKMNYKNKYTSEGYLCDSCESESETNSHILFCPSYALIRQNKDLNSDRDLADYLHRVLEIRSNLRLNR